MSISTVSHAFSGRRPISAPTRARIEAAATELGYGANPLARSLRTGRVGMVGLILRPRDAVHGSLAGTETFTRLLGALATVALENKVGLVHVPDIMDPASAPVPMDGCFVAHPYGNDEVLGELMRRGVPVVAIDEDPDRDLEWCVRLDHTSVVNNLLDGMASRGAKNVLLLTGTEDNAWNRRSREAYEAWCVRRRLPVRHLTLYEGEGVGGAAALLEPVLRSEDRPDAVVAAASRFARGVGQVAADLSISVPEQLMIAALTDSEHTRAHDPPITAVDLVLEELAWTAMELMLSQLDGREPPGRVPPLQPRLHWRASTDRPFAATRVSTRRPPS